MPPKYQAVRSFSKNEPSLFCSTKKIEGMKIFFWFLHFFEWPYWLVFLWPKLVFFCNQIRDKRYFCNFSKLLCRAFSITKKVCFTALRDWHFIFLNKMSAKKGNYFDETLLNVFPFEYKLFLFFTKRWKNSKYGIWNP